MFVVKEGRAVERVVTVGQAIDDRIEITSGLEAGERVATAGFGQITDGVPVSE